MVFAKLSMQSLIFISIIVLSPSNSVIDVKNYIDLIIDFQEFRNITGIVIIYNAEEYALFLTTLVKQVSQSRAYAIAVKQSGFAANYEKLSKTSRQLFVVLLSNEDDLREFTSFAKNEYLFFHVWLLLFHELMSPGMRELCQNPGDNWLDLHVGTELLVKCGNEDAIREWFSTGSRHMIQVHDFIEWNPESRLVVKGHPVLFERRRNLSGIVSRMAYIDEDLAYPLEQRTKDGFGFDLMVRVIEEVATVINIRLQLEKPSRTYGTWNYSDNSWSGILGRLWNETLDIAATDVTITSFRNAFFDFTYPVIASPTYLFIKKPGTTDVPWNAYMKTFSKKVWMMLVFTIIVSPIVLTVIKIKLNAKPRLKDILIDNYMNVWSIYCQQGLPDCSHSPSLKFAYLFIFLSAFILISVYSGSLTSYVTISKPPMPFENVEQFVKDGTYGLTIVRNSIENQVFVERETELIDKMSKLLKHSDELALNYMMGFTQACKERVAFLSGIHVLRKIYRPMPCEIVSIYAERIRYLGMGLKKNDPLTFFLNHYIHRFQEIGVLTQMKSNQAKTFVNPKPPFMPYDLRDVTPLFAILICGYIISIILMLLEFFYCKFSKNHKKKIRN